MATDSYSAGDTAELGYPAIARVKNVMVDNGYVQFETIIFQTNDTYCLKTWYTHVPIVPPLRMAWLVVEEGAYNVSGQYIFAGKHDINRVDSNVANLANFVRFDYISGCDPAAPSDSCKYPAETSVGVITQLQTIVYARLLIPRAKNVNLKFATFVLQPHDSVDSSYYSMPLMESMAYLTFPNNVNVGCVEGFSLETKKFEGIRFV